MPFTEKGYYYPELTDPPNEPAQQALLALEVDANPGVFIGTYAQINALAGAALWEGRLAYQTDTGTNRPVEGLYTYNGVAWRPPWNSAWGIVTPVKTMGVNGTSFTSYAAVSALTTDSFVAVDHRVYRATFILPFVATAGHGAVSKLVDSGTTQLTEATFATDSANSPGQGQVVLKYDGPLSAGAHTITPWLGRADAGGNVIPASSGAGKLATLTVEDIGPNGAPA